MRSTPRLFASLAVGTTLLALCPSNSAVRAESGPAAPGKPSDRPAPEKAAAQPGAVKQGDPAAKPTVEAGTDRGPTQAAAPVTPDEMRFLELTNQERVKRGLNPLRLDPVLVSVARLHSAEMRDKAYFSHTSPTTSLKTPMDRYLKLVSRPGYACVGENLFYCSVVDVQRGHNALMASPTHRENILFPRFERMGVGIVKNEKGEFWVTEMFLTLRDPNLVASKKLSSSR